MKSIFFSLPLAFLVSFSALAQSGKTAVQLDVSAGNVTGQIQTIQNAVQQPQYSEMSAADKSALNQQLAELQQGQLDPVGTSEAQQKVNAILKQAFADSRMVCTFEKPLGSNMKQRNCKTVAAKKREHQKTQNAAGNSGPVMSAGN